MRPLLVLLVPLLALTGCVTPGSELSPSALTEVISAATLEEATVTTLPDGDLVFTLEGTTAGVEERELRLPEGTTYVEAVVTSSAERPFGLIMLDNASGWPTCWPQRAAGWGARSAGPVHCTSIAAASGDTSWTVRIANLARPDVEGRRPAHEFRIDVTVSGRPLDGSAGMLDLATLSRPAHGALPTESFKVPSSKDGTRLHVEVTRPAVDEPVPVILLASPYNTFSRALDGHANADLARYWTARGYAFATMDLRGTGISGGCFAMRGVSDQLDLKDVVEWLGVQPWSTGKVGMWGISYEGFTPVAAAVQQPQHLAAIVASAPAVDTWSNYLPGGVNTGRAFSTVVAGYVVGEAAATTDDPTNPLGPVQYRVDAVCDPTFLLANDPRNLYDAWYHERNLTALAERIQVPVMLEQGFWDNPVKANFVPDLLAGLRVPYKAILGPWPHIWPIRADQELLTLAWFDEHLKGRDTGILRTPPVEVLTNTRLHRAADTWPPRDATTLAVPLARGMYLASPLAVGVPPAPDRLVTRTDPYPEGLYVSGVPTVAFRASLRGADTTYVHAELVEVLADGTRARVIVGWLNAAHREGHDRYAPLAPGEQDDFELKLLPIDHVVRPGSRLELVLRSAHGDEGYGGPEGGLSEPAIVEVVSGELRLPTLPLDALSTAPRSAS